MTNGILKTDTFALLQGSALDAAQMLLGCIVERTIDSQKILVRIVETEAYDQTDIASHSYRGRTERTKVMFGPAGRLYVYFTYGMHYCCNIVVGPSGYGAAVLVRAVEPLSNSRLLEQNRGKKGIQATNGPAKLCQALKIDMRHNGHDLAKQPLRLLPHEPPPTSIVQTARIGISQGKDMRWRFYIKNNPYVST
jgi:DNA-3-methyladenine glycosylase